jgi:hypothetical protein
MPYIQQQDRHKFDSYPVPGSESPGELNYVVTRICQNYIADHGLSYQTLNDIVGVLECCKLEFYRRKISPYEDNKIASNGDVY